MERGMWMLRKRKRIVTAVAMESVLKLFSLFYRHLCPHFSFFDGFDDIYTNLEFADFKKKSTIGGIPHAINWFFYCMLSLFYFSFAKTIQMSVRSKITIEK
jgi:hypothetical protein